jgi:hypothetical protein
VRHSLPSVLLASVAGPRSLAAIGEWVADVPSAVLAALSVRFDPLQLRFLPPGEATHPPDPGIGERRTSRCH